MGKDKEKKGSGKEWEQERISAEARLFEEILSRMDARQADEPEEQAPSQAAGQPATIDLIELFYFCLSKCHLVVIAALVCAVWMGVVSVFFSQPVYTATSKVYIVGQSGDSIILDLQIGTVLTLDYQEVFKTWEVHQMVNDQLGTEYPYSQLQSMLTVTNPEDTRILYITIKHTDPQMAADIANAYAVAAKRFITQSMLTDEPTTFSVALVPSVASSSGMTSQMIKGFLLGTLLAGGLLVLAFVLDTRPKSPEDIMNCSGIPTLAVIPMGMDGTAARRRGERGPKDKTYGKAYEKAYGKAGGEA